MTEAGIEGYKEKWTPKKEKWNEVVCGVDNAKIGRG
jgi:hypothetical protein